jgi:secondary thiamine-phosphate synthase enzyme
MVHTESFTVQTDGRGTHNITAEVDRIVSESGVETGLANVFVHHTSASLILCEDADPSVRRDLEAWISRLVTDGDRIFTHRSEGDDDMSGHIRSILTTNSLGVPVRGGRLGLGTWQGVYLYEHRYRSHPRRITVTVLA